ncbi:DUF4215 domain-containing protein [Nannocystis pusilla]|uniref:DUF4215 domain-containing protein n=1 Tax=Nannocystis pusilla TaxID=889268 RepID=A0A9X3EZ75_9BACT|nr:DUF4215 domain-containing protein [Nannocystis pusilla]MCY1013037.1 DUF4215 domain-containing protein [Nannocystis pusilla]
MSTLVLPSVCGNGVQELDEECDDGNLEEGDLCLSTCVEATCGDGIVWIGQESCDDGNDEDGDDCPSTCVSAHCGDRFLLAFQEACDDGNNVDGDGCSSQCEHEYIMFATSKTFNGNFGSTAAADSLCQEEADAADIPGKYAAWLTVVGEPASKDLPSAPLILRGGEIVVTQPKGLTLGDNTILMAPVNLDAKGNLVDGFAWTGTYASGVPGPACMLWSQGGNNWGGLWATCLQTILRGPKRMSPPARACIISTVFGRMAELLAVRRSDGVSALVSLLFGYQGGCSSANLSNTSGERHVRGHY